MSVATSRVGTYGGFATTRSTEPAGAWPFTACHRFPRRNAIRPATAWARALARATLRALHETSVARMRAVGISVARAIATAPEPVQSSTIVGPSVLDSRLSALNSRLVARGSWLSARGSRLASACISLQTASVASTSVSVSGRGTNTPDETERLSDQNSRIPRTYARGSRRSRRPLSLRRRSPRPPSATSGSRS